MQQIVAGQLCFYRRPSLLLSFITGTTGAVRLAASTRLSRLLSTNSTSFISGRGMKWRGGGFHLQIHSMLLEDRNYVETVRALIQNKGVTAEYAVQMAEANFASAFSSMASPYMQARAVDIHDISQRVIRVLMGDRQELTMAEPAILVADRFLPSEVMDFEH